MSLYLWSSLVALLFSCNPSSGPTDSPPPPAETCDNASLIALGQKHNVQFAFQPCEALEVKTSRWSLDGTQLYFETNEGPHIQRAVGEKHAIAALPIPTPLAGPVWVGPNRFVLPVVEEGPPERRKVMAVTLPDGNRSIELEALNGSHLVEVGDLHVGSTPGELFLVGRSADGGDRRVFLIDATHGLLMPAFPWNVDSVDTFAYSPIAGGIVLLGIGNTVRAHRAKTGEVLGTWPHAVRGAIDPWGRWIALEHEHEPKPGASNLSFVDLKKHTRWTLTTMSGTDFSWYPATKAWANLRVQSIGGQSVTSGTALADLGSVLGMAGAEDGALAPWQAPAK